MAPPRVGLVLGAGGVVGHAFHAGVLSALAEATGFEPGTAETVVGTSAGSVVGAMLRAGVSAADLAARALGRPLSDHAASLLARAGITAPANAWEGPRPFRMSMAEPALLARAALRPWTARPGALAAAVLPQGTVPNDMLTTAFDRLFGTGWPRGYWACSVALSDGRRVVFGRHGAPAATVGQAVAASCAIPGFFAPIEVDGVRYVDGGVHSPTNADVLAAHHLDLVVVVSPMSAARPLGTGMDMAGRRLARVSLAAEVARLRRRGLRTAVFQPTADDRRAMGFNAMDPGRRAAVTNQARQSTFARLERPDMADTLGMLVADG
ncbi:MAG TPA: patatin-like phospholipase family protein [Acidimicrobiales bacterium]|nr:patatin-like phospholipase family protein [Acidimicrobiales bacterium]